MLLYASSRHYERQVLYNKSMRALLIKHRYTRIHDVLIELDYLIITKDIM